MRSHSRTAASEAADEETRQPQKIGARLPRRTPPPRNAGRWLAIWMAAGFVVTGATMPFITSEWPGWIMPTVIGVLVVSVAGPLLVGGWLIGRAIRSRAGVLGALFALGMMAAGAGQFASLVWVAVGGWTAMALTALALFLIVSIPVWRAEARRKEEQARRAARRAGRRAAAVKRGTSLRR